QEERNESKTGIAAERAHGASQGDPAERWLGPQKRHHRKKARRVAPVRKSLHRAAHGLFDGRQENEHQHEAREAGREKGMAPAVILRDPAAAEKAEQQADIETGRIE